MKKKRAEQQHVNVFQSAVYCIADLKGGYRKGLQALKGNSAKVSASNTQDLLGSVDIDECTKKRYPTASRWDYAIGYARKAWFVEVHPANTSNVQEMLKKVQWLEGWLKKEGRPLADIRNDSLYYWIPSGKMCILKNSPQYRSLAMYKLKITNCPFVLKKEE